MYIYRELSRELAKIGESFPVVTVVGPRQVGKTTLLAHTFPDHRYLSMDVASNAHWAETRPDDFLEQHPPPLILDEIQYVPSFFRHIKAWVDAHREARGAIVLTGSQNFQLMASVSDSLAGRAAVVPLLGLSGVEWLQGRTNAPLPAWREFVWKGSFPALWAEPDHPPSRDRWYQGYVATYLERDVRNLSNVGSLRDFERFLRASAARSGQMLNVSELARDVGISLPTARSWLSVLQASGQILLLEPYYRSLGKRLTKTPKLYFTDTGLAAYLMGFTSQPALWASPLAGALWETYVIGQWVRYRDWHQPALSLWYWRDQAGHEVDLLIEKDQRLIPIECKLTERPALRDLSGMAALTRFYGEASITARYLACPIDGRFDLPGEVQVVPGWVPWSLDSKPTDAGVNS